MRLRHDHVENDTWKEELGTRPQTDKDRVGQLQRKSDIRKNIDYEEQEREVFDCAGRRWKWL